MSINPMMGNALIAGNAVARQCACGIEFPAINDEFGRTVAVQTHQRTRGHRAWLAGRGADFDNAHHPKLAK